MKINLKVLSTFLAVAENASFRKAAEETHLSLPAVSMQIKQLEERLGVTLFQRTTRKVELTREGQDLFVSARKAMGELDSALARVQQAADVQHGTLSFACVPTVASAKLPRLLTQFARKYPGVSIRVREQSLPQMVEAVRRCEVDFGIGPQPERPGEFDCHALFEDDSMALMPASHPAATKSEIALRELIRLPLLTLSTSQFQKQFQEALSQSALAPELHYEFTHVSTIVGMVEAGLGIAVLPSVAVPRGAKLKALRIVRPVLTRTISIITVRGHRLSPSAARFVEMCEMLVPKKQSRTSD